jgi:predicted dehydrogenase/aryl-alcohol dehydrogenase-like predicted oxidoreductase
MTEPTLVDKEETKRTSPGAKAPLTLRWGIAGTGAIARQFAEALGHSHHGRLVSVVRHRLVSPVSEVFKGATVHDEFDALLSDPQVDAIYIATPHPTHAGLAIRAAEARKHVLCEKPLGMNAAEAMAVADAAARHGVVVMEAFMYRTHPQTLTLIDVLRAGAIGEITLIQASYGYRTGFDAQKRHFDPLAGGGAILDVGCYCTSLCGLVAGVAAGKSFVEPVELKAVGHLGQTGVDERASAVLRFGDDLLAQVSASITTVQDNCVRIFGTDGRIELRSPWFCSGKTGGRSAIEVVLATGETQTHAIETNDWLYAIEADFFAGCVEHRAVSWPALTLDDTIANLRVLDAWRQAIGLDYPAEQPGRRVTLSGRELRRDPETAMVYDDRLGLGKQTSRLAIGGMALSTFPLASVVYDAFFEAGGTVFDTAYVYGQGKVDRLLGQWMASRGIREDVVVIGKGAHTPHCRPDAIRPQLLETLERLQTDYIDLYFLHRDDTSVPVGEFVDVLDELAREGLIRRYGGSNWTLARIDEGNAYASQRGKQGFTLLSNNFSLAEMIEPMWEGCISSSDEASTAWLDRTRTPIFAWSSQARGFFTHRAGRDRHDDPTLARCWYSETNFERRDRACQLAERHGVSAARIALAYLLAQPFPVFPIIGPANLAELRDSLGVLEVSLTPREALWLHSGKGTP